MTTNERTEHARLLRLWAMGKATRRQIERCMALDRKNSRVDLEQEKTNAQGERHGD